MKIDIPPLVVEILSAGVIAALVTGTFSLFISNKNNKRITELKKSKQRFTLNQERFKAIRDAYDELLDVLPEEKLLGHTIMNYTSIEDYEHNGFAEFNQIGEKNMKIMYSHFEKYCYLFSEDERLQIVNIIEQLDDIARQIVELKTDIGIDCEEINNDDSFDALHSCVAKRITKISEFEIMYYQMFKEKLSNLAN